MEPKHLCTFRIALSTHSHPGQKECFRLVVCHALETITRSFLRLARLSYTIMAI